MHDHVRDFIVQFPKTRFIFESVTALECDGSRKNSEINKTIDRFNKLMFRCSLDHDNIDYFDNVRFRQTHLSADGLYLDHNGQAELSKCWIHCILLTGGIRNGSLPRYEGTSKSWCVTSDRAELMDIDCTEFMGLCTGGISFF